MAFQLRHHGIEIPAEFQPRCPACGSGMSLHRMEHGLNVSADWYCLAGQTDTDCDGQVAFTDWIARPDLPAAIRDHFVDFLDDHVTRAHARLERAGYVRVAELWAGEGQTFQPDPSDVCLRYVPGRWSPEVTEYWRPPAGAPPKAEPDPVAQWLGS